MKECIISIFCLLMFSLSYSQKIEEGEYIGTQQGVKSITFSEITDKKFKINFLYKKIFELNSTPEQRPLFYEFFKINSNLYGTNDKSDGNGFYCQIKNDHIIIYKVNSFLINSIDLVGKQLEKEKLNNLKVEYTPVLGKYICLTECSPVHEKNKGKIVFSKQPILLNNEQEALFVKDWNMIDDLYFRVYLDKTTRNSALENFSKFDSYGYNIYLDGELLKENVSAIEHLGNDDSKLINTKTTRQEAIIGKSEYIDIASPAYKTALMYADSKFTPGLHNLTIAYIIKGDGKVIELAKGDIKITVTQAGISKIMNDYTYWGVPKAKMVNKTYEQNMLEAINAYADTRGWKEEYKKVSIISDFWIVNNEYSGAITGRAIKTVCFAKSPNGNCTFLYVTFFQQYEGNGSYSPNFYFSSYDSQYGVPCSIGNPK